MKNIINVRSDRRVKDNERTAIPANSNPGSQDDDSTSPPVRIRVSIITSQKIFLRRGFKGGIT
ncbi:MAG TPA: hypothetical protein PKM76_00105 [Bacteroidales bacterium]|jgi:hypothetical protein|nr:hypothetical protein [Bacteroidales bacterium]